MSSVIQNLYLGGLPSQTPVSILLDPTASNQVNVGGGLKFIEPTNGLAAPTVDGTTPQLVASVADVQKAKSDAQSFATNAIAQAITSTRDIRKSAL